MQFVRPIEAESRAFFEALDRGAAAIAPIFRDSFLDAVEVLRAQAFALSANGLTWSVIEQTPEIWGEFSRLLNAAYQSDLLKPGIDLVLELTARATGDPLSTAGYDAYRASMTAWAELHGAARVTAITDETRAGLRDLIVASARNPESRATLGANIFESGLGLDRRRARTYAEFVAGLRDEVVINGRRFGPKTKAAKLYEALRKDRARVIASTEGQTYAAAGQDLALRTLRAAGGLNGMELEWVTRLIRVCPICRALDGQRRAIEGGVFTATVNGKIYTFERPTAHPLCACGVRTVRIGRETNPRPYI